MALILKLIQGLVADHQIADYGFSATRREGGRMPALRSREDGLKPALRLIMNDYRVSLHLDALAGDFAIHPPQQTAEHAAGSDLVELIEPLVQQVTHRILPADRL
jgi:hypothetical protein